MPPDVTAPQIQGGFVSMLVLFSFSQEMPVSTAVLCSWQLLAVGSVTLPVLFIPGWEKSLMGQKGER